MNIYLDKANLISLIAQKDKSNYNDCIRVLQRQLDCYFNFPKKVLAENAAILAWFRKNYTQGVGKTDTFFLPTPFPQRPLKTNCYQKFEIDQLSSIFLLEDENIDNLKEKGAILLGNVGEEIVILSRIFLQNGDYKFDKKLRIGSDDFKNWNDLEKYQFETTDILIFDQYILSDETSIRDNLLPLLKVLTTLSFVKINLVIYTKLIPGHLSYDEVKSSIKAAIRESTSVKVNFTLVKYRDQRDVHVVQAEHDRTIFTNYCRYYSGDTFNYWNADGTKKTKGRELHISCLADKETHKLAKELILDIQNNINNLPPEYIQGDKKSNFLSFE